MTSTPGDENTPSATERTDSAATPTTPVAPAPAAPLPAAGAQPAAPSAWASPTAATPQAAAPSQAAATSSGRPTEAIPTSDHPTAVLPTATPVSPTTPVAPYAAPASPYAAPTAPVVATPQHAAAPSPYAAPAPQQAAPAAPYPAPAQPAPFGPFRAQQPTNPFAAPSMAGGPQAPGMQQPAEGAAFGVPTAGAAFGVPAGTSEVPGPRRRPTWVLVTTSALVSALVAGGTTFGVLEATGNRGSTRPASIAQIGQSTTDQVPVAGSSTGSPDWEAVAKAVKASVVAITVTTQQGVAEGSGVVLDAQGHVLTNNHVVDGAENKAVQVTLSDGRILDADVVGTDPTTDLAVVKLTDPPSDLQPAALGDSSTVTVGEQVMAVGNPLGLQNTVTTGIVSAIDRPVTTATSSDSSSAVVTNAIQVDAAINPGNSGGPLFDGEGKVLGITSSIASLSASNGSSESGSIGLGFAIPVNLAKDIASQLISSGSAQHALLGVRLSDGTATADGVTRRGAKVASVTPGSPADKAGVRADDVIVAIGDNPTPGADSLTAYVRSMNAGDTATLTLVRDGKSLKVDATLVAKTEQAVTNPSGSKG